MKPLLVTEEMQKYCMGLICENGFNYFYNNEINQIDIFTEYLNEAINKFLLEEYKVSRKILKNFCGYIAIFQKKFKSKYDHDKFIKDSFSLDEIYQSQNDVDVSFRSSIKNEKYVIDIMYELVFEECIKENKKC